MVPMRIPGRSLATLLLAVGVATCSDTPIAAVKTGSSPQSKAGIGRIAFAPSFSKSAVYAAEHLADFGYKFDNVHVQIRGTPDTTVIVVDTTITFNPSSPDQSLDFTLPVPKDR